MLFTWNTTSSSERFDFFISSLQVDIICETEQLLNRKLGDILQSTLMESISVKDTFFNNNLFIGTNIHCKVNYSSHPVDPQQQQLLSYPLDATFHPLNNWGQVNNASMDTQQFMEKIGAITICSFTNYLLGWLLSKESHRTAKEEKIAAYFREVRRKNMRN